MQMIAAYREPGRAPGPALMVKLIESLSHGVPAALSELPRIQSPVAPSICSRRMSACPMCRACSLMMCT